VGSWLFVCAGMECNTWGRTFVLHYPNLHAFCVNGTVSGVLGSPDELWMAAQCLNWVSVRGSLDKKKDGLVCAEAADRRNSPAACLADINHCFFSFL
jgi:hypothetical protein